MTRRWSVPFFIVLLANLSPATTLAADPVVDWTRQFGTSASDHAFGVAVDGSGRIVVAGTTEGTLPGQANEGYSDAFVQVYQPDGSIAWTRQFGTSEWDWAYAVAVDGKGRIAVAGDTTGTFPGQAKQSYADAFVRVYRPDGSIAWTRQFGTRGEDRAGHVAVDGKGRVVVTGSTRGIFPGRTSRGGYDAFVRVYRPDGRVAWTRQFGTRGDDYPHDIAVDPKGRIVVAGETDGTLPGQTYRGGYYDAFVRVYRPDGRVAWTRQFGTRQEDSAGAIAVDAKGRIAVAGDTTGTFPGQTSRGDYDAFVRVYRPDGRVANTRQFGTRGDDWAYGTAVDPKGRIVVAGETWGTFHGQASEGDADAFIRKYGAGGRVAWTRQFGTAGSDDARVAVDATGRLAVAGSTWGTFPGQTSEGGGSDAFVRVYDQP